MDPTIDDFVDESFEVDRFVVQYLGAQDDNDDNLVGSLIGDASLLDAEDLLIKVGKCCQHVDSLRQDARLRLQEASKNADSLYWTHTNRVRSLKVESQLVLERVQNLESEISTVGSKAVNVGRRLDQVNRQRRRAQEASKAIKIYDKLCGEEEDDEVLQMLVPRQGKQDLMHSALMIRKVEAAVKSSTSEGHERAKVKLEEAKKRFEHFTLQCFDDANEVFEGSRNPSALHEMKHSAEALTWFNGGQTIVQHYIATRKFFIDPTYILQDRAEIDQLDSLKSASSILDRIVDELVDFADHEVTVIPQIFPNTERVMIALVQRMCLERLQPAIEGLLDNTMEQFGLHDWLELLENVVCSCQRLHHSLGTDKHETGEVMSQQALDEVRNLIEDSLLQYRDAFLARQLEALQVDLQRYFPQWTDEHVGIFLNDESSMQQGKRETPPSTQEPEAMALSDVALRSDMPDGIEQKRSMLVHTAMIDDALSRVGQAVKRCLRVLEDERRPQALQALITALVDKMNEFLFSAVRYASSMIKQELAANKEPSVAIVCYFVVYSSKKLQDFSAAEVVPYSSSDVRAHAAITDVLSKAMTWTESATSHLATTYAKSLLSFFESTLQKQPKTDFLHVKSSGEELGHLPTDTCVTCVKTLRVARDAWLYNGPTPLHGKKTSFDKYKKFVSSAERSLDVNTLKLFSSIADRLHQTFSRHICRFTYSQEGGLRLLQDLKQYQQIVGDLFAHGHAKEIEELREAANVLVLSLHNVELMVKENAWREEDRDRIIDMIIMRSDWSSLRPKVIQKLRAFRPDLK
ncbi:Sec10 protein [Guillardia theta CCMP2712]|uniref:Sec10 protein n=2 Tax=Guillardia theta TaxID=55529 RepID=L1JK28_GUITC|nr:Sec10 protein [Guillardia theta CCMP2712]EKX48692.1 Sec10 protein [Guillardia theta CCMP2712]|eukprot:XP_005835672.1 Sec10 protein [Guillardia theta CCMP2712]